MGAFDDIQDALSDLGYPMVPSYYAPRDHVLPYVRVRVDGMTDTPAHPGAGRKEEWHVLADVHLPLAATLSEAIDVGGQLIAIVNKLRFYEEGSLFIDFPDTEFGEAEFDFVLKAEFRVIVDPR